MRPSILLLLAFFFTASSEAFLFGPMPQSPFSQLVHGFKSHVKKFAHKFTEDVGKLEAQVIDGVEQVAGSVLQIADELIHHGLRLAKIEELFSKRNFTHYRHEHQNIGLLKQLLPKIVFDSTLKIADPILRNVEAGLSKYLFQGDIVLTDEQLDDLSLSFDDVDDIDESEEKSLRKKRQITRLYSRWRKNTLYYFLDESVDSNTRKSIKSALKYIEGRTCIRFKKDENARNRVRVFRGNGCYSSIGMVGGQQDLSLGEGCSVIGTVAHEFAHALGVWHTQMRDDRDQYVTIDLDAIKDNFHSNFAKLKAYEVYSITPYEYGSFMHYSSNSFGRDRDSITIIPNSSEYTYTMGNRMISFYDMIMLNHHYKCDRVCPRKSVICSNGGYPNPSNCKKCVCPLGYGGRLCDQLPDEGGEVLLATNDWQTYKIELGENTTELRDEFLTITHWIVAPPGYKIEVKLSSMYNSQCQISCPYNGIEIKKLPDVRVTNPRICCSEYKNIVYTSENNPTPIITYNRYNLARFSIKYRYAQDYQGQTHEDLFLQDAQARTPVTRGDRSLPSS